jgi:uncharacterized OB-fold protein
LENDHIGLKMVWCEKCDKYYVPPKYICANCGSSVLKEKSTEGKGEIYSFTKIYYPPLAYSQQGPYEIAIIKLRNGTKLLARIVDKEGSLKIGQEVTFVRKDGQIYSFRVKG